MRKLLNVCVLITLACLSTQAQDDPERINMQGLSETTGMSQDMQIRSSLWTDILQQRATSGTDAEPSSTPLHMLMTTKGNWTLMFHGEAFLNEFQQTGARAADKLFSTNWFIPMAQREAGGGLLTLRAMLSLEPATVTQRRYPELFEQGETAFGRPIVDGQHPHDFFMELAALYDYKSGEKTMLSFYAAPVGDPAMGPPAYPHRASAHRSFGPSPSRLDANRRRYHHGWLDTGSAET